METAIVVALIAAVCSAIVAPIINAILGRAKRHNEHEESESDEMAKWKTHVDECLDKDNKRISSIENGVNALVKSQMQMINHEIDGNHVDRLIEARDGLHDYLINRG